jgi:hypothetical protein
MLGTDPSIPELLRIPDSYRIDVQRVSDTEIMFAIARLIHAYMDSIRFGTVDTNRNAGSPYDLFLKKNGLPVAPHDAESNLAYSRRLLRLIHEREHFQWVTTADGHLELHAQIYQFGKLELAALKIFLSEEGDTAGERSIGNCVSCHPPPQFTDHKLHNTGVSQIEYDALHGSGAFAALEIPDLHTRNAEPNAYLPATAQHPNAVDRYRSAPSMDKPGFADLGVWNVFANADYPKPQQALIAILCSSPYSNACTPELLLPHTIALFKTPSLRDLGHSQPYFHSGAAETLEDAMAFYVATTELARASKLRNGSRELQLMHLSAIDIASLAAFLRALNEDYH